MTAFIAGCRCKGKSRRFRVARVRVAMVTTGVRTRIHSGARPLNGNATASDALWQGYSHYGALREGRQGRTHLERHPEAGRSDVGLGF